MEFKLPEAVKPVANLVMHVAIGAILFAAILVIEVLLAGFIRLLEIVPFAPTWLESAADALERGLFFFDVFVAILFLIAELIKLVIGFVKEIRHG